MAENMQYQIEESGVSSNQQDKPTDYNNIKKKNFVSNFISIPILIIKILCLGLKTLIEELFNNYKRKNSYSKKKNIFFIYNSAMLKNNWYLRIKKKDSLYLNFTSPYPNLKERVVFGSIDFQTYLIAIKAFIGTSFISLKKKGNLTNLRFSLVELMSLEKFFTYLICIHINLNFKKKRLNIYHQYENLPRDLIILNYLSKHNIYSCITTPIYRYDRPNITNIPKRKIKPKKLIFFYFEKYFAFKKEKNLKYKIESIAILKKNKINIKKNSISKLIKKKYFKKYIFKLSDCKSEEILIEKIFKNNPKVILNYHPTSEKYTQNKNENLDKALIISSSYTNAAYNFGLKGIYSILYYTKINSKSPYKYINIPKYNIYEIKKLIR